MSVHGSDAHRVLLAPAFVSWFIGGILGIRIRSERSIPRSQALPGTALP